MNNCIGCTGSILLVLLTSKSACNTGGCAGVSGFMPKIGNYWKVTKDDEMFYFPQNQTRFYPDVTQKVLTIEDLNTGFKTWISCQECADFDKLLQIVSAAEVVEELPSAIIGARISYNGATKIATVTTDGYSDFGSLSIGAVTWDNYGGGTISGNTIDLNSDPNFSQELVAVATVTDGVNSVDVTARIFLDLPNNSSYQYAPNLSLAPATGTLTITSATDIVGSTFTEKIPLEDGYKVSGGADITFANSISFSVVSGDLVEANRAENTSTWDKHLRSWGIFF